MVRNSIIVCLSLATCIAQGYDHPQFDELRKQINTKFVNKTSYEFLLARENEKSMPNEFQRFLNDDEMMQGVRQISQEGASGTKLTTVQFSRDVKADLDAKGNELVAELVSSVTKRDVSALVLFFGGLIIASGAYSSQPIITGVGALVSVSGIAGCARYGSRAGIIPGHLKDVNTMEEKWSNFFVEKQAPSQK